jgi:uncharacterized protein (TIGR02757 family)
VEGKVQGRQIIVLHQSPTQGQTSFLEQIYRQEREKLAGIVADDPLWFARRYEDRQDLEIAGFLASQFAYGRVEGIRGFLGKLFSEMGDSPHRFVTRGDFGRLRPLYYRFHKGDEIVDLFTTLKGIVEEFGGLGKMMETFYEGTIRQTLADVRTHLFGDTDRLLFFFPRPFGGSALKRWNLYLRWMVRKDEIDLGVWDFIDTKDLIVPLDANIYKIGRCRGWTTSKTASWKAACEITEALKRSDPADPVKYDFLLCHMIGIRGGCTGTPRDTCRERCLVHAL